MLITRTKSEKQPEPVPPPAWEQQLEDLRGQVINTLNDIEQRIQKVETRFMEYLRTEATREVRKAVEALPQTLTAQAAAIESLRKDLQELANDFDQSQLEK
jgi:methyl-accepting chemotaxis protein